MRVILSGHAQDSTCKNTQGLETVRAFRLQERFVARDQAMLEESNRAFWPIHCVNRCASSLKPCIEDTNYEDTIYKKDVHIYWA